MAQAMERILGDRIASGIVVTKTCHTLPLYGNIDLVEGGHPVPDAEGLKGTRKIVMYRPFSVNDYQFGAIE